MSDGPYERSGVSDRPVSDRPVSDHPIIASKIILKIIMKIIEGKAMNVTSKMQLGFRKGMGTRKAIEK